MPRTACPHSQTAARPWHEAYHLARATGISSTMSVARRSRERDPLQLIDPDKLGRSKRPGDRAVTCLLVLFVGLAVMVLSFAVMRSRSANSGDIRTQPVQTGNPVSDGFRVVRVLDGDTVIIVGRDNIELTLRLAGVDAPEMNQPFGHQSAEFLAALLSDQTIHLDDVKREKFGRVLAHAYLGSRWVDLEIVRQGWAWVYPDSDSRVLREAEHEARAERAGLWSAESPMSPWEWREDGK